jgi:5'-nucleotidase
MNRNRAFALLLITPLVLAAGQVRRPPVRVQLLAINDFHGHLEPPSGENGLIEGTPAGGAEYLATHLKLAARDHPNSLVVAPGDVIGASPLLSALFHDEPTIESMNGMNLAVASVGNHEFDQGGAELLRMQRGGCHATDGCQDGDPFDGAHFQYLSANVVDAWAPTAAPLLPATAIRTIGGVRIGFIGETLQGTKQVVLAERVRNLAFLDEAATANMYAEQLKQQGVRTIVLLIHEGGQQRAEGALDPNGCANFSGALPAILPKLSPDIRVVVSGHTHRFYNCSIGGRLVTSASSYGRMLTRINLSIDPASGELTGAAATNEVVTRDVEKDPAQTRLIEKYAPLARPFADRVVGSITASIVRKENGAGESPLGNLIADAQLASTSPADRGGAEVAMMNPGGIRADLVFDPGAGADAGKVTFGQLWSVQPYGNVLTVRTMTGNMIKRVLEQQFDNPVPGRQTMLQVSSGFSYRYSLNAAPGTHVDATSIRIGSRPIGPSDRVRVTSNNFLTGGGDNFSVFEEGTDPIAGEIDIDATVAHFRAGSPISPGALNRISRVD